MAQTKKKRRRKHSGTQAGTVERSAASAPGGRSKAAGKQASRERREARLDTPPTWRGAVGRAAIAALIFAVVVVLLFRRPPVEGITLAAVMFVIYIPMSYYTDRFTYNRRQRRKRGGGGSRTRRLGR